jgi:hypothetical protein
MQETVNFPESPDVDTTWCACDKCNSDMDPSNTFDLPAEWAAALKLPANSAILRGVFMGPFEDAVKDGWEERDWGYICPVCKMEEAGRDEGENELLTKDLALDMIEAKEVPNVTM